MPGSVRRTADGWVADVTVGGTRRTRKAKTRNEALAHKRELLEQLMNRTVTCGGLTIKEARELSIRIRWAGKAYERTAAIYSQEAVDFFGPSTQLGSLTAPMVESWRQKLIAKGNRPSTINMKVGTIKSMFADAVLHGHLDQIPPLPKQLRLKNTRDRVISDQERDAMCRFFQEVGEPAAANMLVFLLETGCRWGEAEKLKGKDVDMEKGQVTFWETKNGRPRTVPLTRRAIDAITPYVPAVIGHRVWPYKYWRFAHLFTRAKGALGLEDETSLTVHSTRHTCASKLAAQGISLYQLMAFGGWTSLASVQRYLHLQTDALAACVAALEG